MSHIETSGIKKHSCHGSSLWLEVYSINHILNNTFSIVIPLQHNTISWVERNGRFAFGRAENMVFAFRLKMKGKRKRRFSPQ